MSHLSASAQVEQEEYVKVSRIVPTPARSLIPDYTCFVTARNSTEGSKQHGVCHVRRQVAHEDVVVGGTAALLLSPGGPVKVHLLTIHQAPVE